MKRDKIMKKVVKNTIFILLVSILVCLVVVVDPLKLSLSKTNILEDKLFNKEFSEYQSREVYKVMNSRLPVEIEHIRSFTGDVLIAEGKLGNKKSIMTISRGKLAKTTNMGMAESIQDKQMTYIISRKNAKGEMVKFNTGEYADIDDKWMIFSCDTGLCIYDKINNRQIELIRGRVEKIRYLEDIKKLVYMYIDKNGRRVICLSNIKGSNLMDENIFYREYDRSCDFFWDARGRRLIICSSEDKGESSMQTYFFKDATRKE